MKPLRVEWRRDGSAAGEFRMGWALTFLMHPGESGVIGASARNGTIAIVALDDGHIIEAALYELTVPPEARRFDG
jgi:hypothetical protein